MFRLLYEGFLQGCLYFHGSFDDGYKALVRLLGKAPSLRGFRIWSGGLVFRALGLRFRVLWA